jgi:hypothetical protein
MMMGKIMMMMIKMNLDDDGPLCSDITQTVDETIKYSRLGLVVLIL